MQITTKISLKYKNPVYNYDFADPCVIKATDGYYYAYATQLRDISGIINIQVTKSKNLIEWGQAKEALPVKPKWAETTQDFWAPEVIEYKGEFLMYYCAKNAKTKGMSIGIAKSKNPMGPFIDIGNPLCGGKKFIHIDPMIYKENGKLYMVWGSCFEPIRIRELSENGECFAKDSKEINIIWPFKTHRYGNLIEAPYIFKRKGYYYLLISGDHYLENYAVLVARSKNLYGPYILKSEDKKEGSSVVIESGKYLQQPGHNYVIKDEKQNDWIVYHAIDTKDMHTKGTDWLCRKLCIDRIYYDKKGWPYVKRFSPSKRPLKVPTV